MSSSDDQESPNHSLSQWPPKMAVCAGAVVLKQNQVLFIRQAPGHSLAGQWSIPWGLVDRDETPDCAAVREIFEESGITAEVTGLLGIQNLRTPGWLGVIFLCRHLDGVPTPDGVETDRAAYLDLADISTFTEPIEPWCKWLSVRVLTGEYRVIPSAPENPYHPQTAFL